jgi:subtilisin family serine protease
MGGVKMDRTKYVIFVDDDLVAGSAQVAAATAGAASAGNPPTASDALLYRRSVLADLAQALSGGISGQASSAAVDAMMEPALAGQTAAAVESGAATAAFAESDAVQILEGVGALVVDAEAFDVASLEGVIGLTVAPNVELRLPVPVRSEVEATAREDWHLRQIGLESGASGGDGVVIGVLDTGIDSSHPEFAGKTIHFAEFDAVGRRCGGGARDAGEHGTHVCSIAAGARAGVAPGARLAVAAVLTANDGFGRMSGSLVQIANGFDWLVKTDFGGERPGADLINASLGGSGFNPYLQRVVRNAFALGIPVIAAIGNNGRTGSGHHSSPGNFPETLSVGATDPQDVVADFSDWGIAPPPTGPRYGVPELCAPGVNVLAAKPGGGMQPMSGTSMATPLVSGVAARRIAANPALRRQPWALFADLRSRIAPYHPGKFGNNGGIGRIVA